ncbi:fibronectin type III domain-containing protein [Cellulomonas sp. zg-ZUI22]|uniref:fibronectin type III domain-containing protein n=1 Tax=Cellulomonas sp. zg-ZUI22 TaxID=2816955 RepID=UPI001A94DA60|nr:fibronectin type III domain-containing protein [Cellulomonas sp. zg-ZUI22]MBO0901678.1 fibronectin type III domain-containing protein [Cellulomonas sp. zg-ZUI22]
MGAARSRRAGPVGDRPTAALRWPPGVGRLAAVVAASALVVVLSGAAPAVRAGAPGAEQPVGDAAADAATTTAADAATTTAADAATTTAADAAATALAPSVPEALVSADPLPTAQIDGVAWAQVVQGDVVYVGGGFANARPAGAAPGTSLSPRANLMAYDLTTGVMTAWNPGANGQVLALALSPDGTRLYVGGAFTSVAGQARYRVAAFDTATGALVTSFRPQVNGKVQGIAATQGTVYLTGEFTGVDNVPRTRVAAVSASTGQLLPFAPTLAGGWGGRAVVVSPDGARVVLAGSFESVNGSTNPGRGMAALDPVTGASLPWPVNSVIRNGGQNAAVYSLSSDGDSVYGTGYDFGGTSQDGFEGAFRASWTGQLRWIETCRGDTYAIAALGGHVYTASHSHNCSAMGSFPEMSPRIYRHGLVWTKEPSGRTVSFKGVQRPATSRVTWYPQWWTGSYTGMSQAAFSITGTAAYVAFGGEFPRVAGVAQQGLVRFTTRDRAPNRLGPQVQGGAWALTPTVTSSGVRLAWTANHDQDDEVLRYEVLRQDRGSTPLQTVEAASTFWSRPAMSFVDTSVVPGTTYRYRVRATDRWGAWTWTDWTTVATPAGAQARTAVPPAATSPTAPGATSPDVTAPGTTAPGTTAPDVTAPEVTAPQAPAAPDAVAPDALAPDAPPGGEG